MSLRRLGWDDPALRVSSDPPLRARYRLLQSWYRENILDADHVWLDKASGPVAVGSQLAPHELQRDRSLNFLLDRELLAYADRQVIEARRRQATLSEPRLRGNMLSSMPMAFILGGLLASAPDRDELVRRMFDLELDSVDDVIPEWAPDPVSHLGDRTAFDLAVFFTKGGRKGVLGIETKYTEPLSQKPYDCERYREVTEQATSYFSAGAADALLRPITNQLWRHRMLAASMRLSGVVEHAEMAAVGLAEDASLWSAHAALEPWISEGHPFRATPWERVVEVLRDSSLRSMALLFEERYLDLTPVGRGVRYRWPRRSTVASETERQWALQEPAMASRPSSEAGGDGEGEYDWGRWMPTVWRALADPTRTIAVPHRPPPDLFEGALAYWTPAAHLLVYRLAWPSPSLGLQRWMDLGRPLDDPTFSLVEALWGRDLPSLYRAFCGIDARLGSAPSAEPDVDVSTMPSPLSTPWEAHLGRHMQSPVDPDWLGDGPRSEAALVVGDLATSGPPRATLITDSYIGWYHHLATLGATLPDGGAERGWRVDVIVTPIGHLGTFRQSRSSGRWFVGRHMTHELGIS